MAYAGFGAFYVFFVVDLLRENFWRNGNAGVRPKTFYRVREYV
jgi:hypothetical protein